MLIEGYLTWKTFTADTKITSEYNFNTADDESMYKKAHLPAWLIGEDTKLQVVSVGQTIQLPKSDLNKNICSSDTTIVTVNNGKITGVKPGVAIVYRYNENYSDIFYVIVKKQGAPKTIKSNIYKETTKTYYKSSDYAPFINGGQAKDYRTHLQVEAWEALRIHDLEPIFGNGSQLTTKYSNGQIECFITKDGKSEWWCVIGKDK